MRAVKANRSETGISAGFAGTNSIVMRPSAVSPLGTIRSPAKPPKCRINPFNAKRHQQANYTTGSGL